MNFSADSIPRGFNADFALNTALPLAQAAYAVMQAPDNPPQLPPGWVKTGLITVNADPVSRLIAFAEKLPLLHIIHGEPNTFGLMGKSIDAKTAFVSFRGTQNQLDWVHNGEIARRSYSPIPGAGDVHEGFQSVYMTLRPSIHDNLATMCAGCDSLLITGHSLGGALAVLSVLDVASAIPATMRIEVCTFAGPRAGCVDFTRSFNERVSVCYRVVATADIVPHVPLPAPEFPYEHVGTEIHIDEGSVTNPITAHSLALSYKPGLEKLQKLLAQRAAA